MSQIPTLTLEDDKGTSTPVSAPATPEKAKRAPKAPAAAPAEGITEESLRKSIDTFGAKVAELGDKVKLADVDVKATKKALAVAVKAAGKAATDLKLAPEDKKVEAQAAADKADAELAAAKDKEALFTKSFAQLKAELANTTGELKKYEKQLADFGKVTESQKKAQEAKDAKEKAEKEAAEKAEAAKKADTEERDEARKMAEHLTSKGKHTKLVEHLLSFADRPEKAAGRTRSKTDGPVAKVHAICAANPGARRKDLVALAVAEGISEGTAKSQIQVWLSEHK